MTNTSLGTPLQRLVTLSAIQNENECVVVDHAAMLETLTNTTILGGVNRLWFYQTCTEFAYFQARGLAWRVCVHVLSWERTCV